MNYIQDFQRLAAGCFGVYLYRDVQSWTQLGPEAGARPELSSSSSTLESSRHSSAEGKAAEQEGPHSTWLSHADAFDLPPEATAGFQVSAEGGTYRLDPRPQQLLGTGGWESRLRTGAAFATGLSAEGHLDTEAVGAQPRSTLESGM